MKISDFLKIRAHPVITIGPNDTLSSAAQKLVENNIGALPVCDNQDVLVGIISERDLLKECSQRSGTLGNTRVQDVMTKSVAVGTPKDDLDYATSVMKQKGIRHLPIVVDQKLAGIISIRDIVSFQLEETKAQIRYIGLLPRRTHFGRRL
jgi:CBS domain-containing protein